MNIAPYRAKLPDLPLPEKRHGGAFRTIPWERYPHPREKTVEVTFHACGYKKKANLPAPHYSREYAAARPKPYPYGFHRK